MPVRARFDPGSLTNGLQTLEGHASIQTAERYLDDDGQLAVPISFTENNLTEIDAS